MEVQPHSVRQRPSVDPIRTECAMMAVNDNNHAEHIYDSDDSPIDDEQDEICREETPIFREPNWSATHRSSVDDPARPVLLQPVSREDGMKQHDKALVARLDRGSSSSASGSPIALVPDGGTARPASNDDGRTTKSHQNPEGKVSPSQASASQDFTTAPQPQQQSPPDTDTQPQRRHSEVLPAPPQPQQHRPQYQQKRPAPLTLSATRRDSAHQPSRLPSLTRLVPTGEQQQSQHQRTAYRAHTAQDHRRLARISKPAINSPTTYSAYTPVQVVPSWQSIPFGWTPVTMPIQVPMQGPTASPRQIFSPQTQRVYAQAQKHPVPAPTATPTSATASSSSSGSSPAPQLREDLWKVGSQYLANPKTADAFVRAVEIRYGQMSRTGLPNGGPDKMEVDGANHKQENSSPDGAANPFGDTLVLRVVLYSPGKTSIAMTREFDRRKLRETIPDFSLPSKSPKSGSNTSPVPGSAASVVTPVSAISSLSLARRRKSQIRAQNAGTPTTPEPTGPTRRLTMPPVPIHIPFARAHAPALAAVLVCREAQKGDSIDLPMPFPGAWLETSAYMYTGHTQLLSDRVKMNLWYLGGVPSTST